MKERVLELANKEFDEITRVINSYADDDMKSKRNWDLTAFDCVSTINSQSTNKGVQQ